MNEWHDDDAFWEDLEPVLFSDERLRRAPDEADQVIKLLNITSGSYILDMGCGSGRHALEFARRSYHVTGVDRTAKYLAGARERATEQGLDIEWVQADMRHFCRTGTFDVAVSLLTSFGYFADPVDDRRVVENLFASLKPGGRLVMDLMGKEVLARIYRQHDWHQEPDGTLLLEERRLTDDWSRVEVRWIIIQDEQRREHRFELRLYSAAELQALLGDAGFSEIRAYGSLKGAPYDHQAERLVILARKP